MRNVEFEDTRLTEIWSLKPNELEELKKEIRENRTSYSNKELKEYTLVSIRIQMENYVNSDKTGLSVGYFLKELLKELQISQRKFAVYIGLRASNFHKIITGDRPVNYELALIFGRIFKIEPMLWLHIQSKSQVQSITKAQEQKIQKYSLEELLDSYES